MEGIEAFLRSEFPEATEAEVKRFVRSCAGNKKTPGQLKKDAETILEDYLDWRNCYGLDHREGLNSRYGNNSNDAEDWKFAVEKALEVNSSIRRAQELEKKSAEEQTKKDGASPGPVNYDIDVSDSQCSSEGMEAGEDEAENVQTDNLPANELTDEQKKEQLQQIIYQHTDSSREPITDKDGGKILHVLPGLINRQVAQADTYALILSFYLDRKFDRSSEEKMTVVIDVRAGEGWPNPAAFMMVKFVRTIIRQLQSRYPERLKSLIVFPVPWAAMGVWTAIRRVFRHEIMEKITLISGPADRAAPLPKGQMEGLIDSDVLDCTEQFRLNLFKLTEASKK